MKLIAALIIVLLAGSASAIQLGGPSSLALLESLQNSSNASGLWTWGSVPTGHILLNNSSITGAWIPEADKSVMETPSEAIPQNGANMQSVEGFATAEEFGKSNKGVFDATEFKVPTQV